LDLLPGPIDTSVTVTGSGYLASTPITITYDTAGVITTPLLFPVIPRAVSSLLSRFPPAPVGPMLSKPVTAQIRLLLILQVHPLRLLRRPAAGGTSVSASGNGFKSNGTITIIYNGIQAGTATADAKVIFTATFTITSASTGGPYSGNHRPNEYTVILF